MNLDKLKNLVKHNGDKFIFVENGEPEMVMMSFHEYQKLLGSDSNLRTHSNDSNDPILPPVSYSDHSGAAFESFESPLESLESPMGGLPVRLEDIRLEDLPI